MTLLENPYFRHWIARNLARMDIGNAGEQALTLSAARIQCLSSEIFDGNNPTLEHSAMRVVTNLMARLRNHA